MESVDYVQSESIASLVHNENPHDLHNGDHILLCGKPCRIVNFTCCKNGKHGSAKYMFTGLDIFTGKKYEDYFMKDAPVPEIERITAKLMGIADDDYLSLLMEDLTTREDLKLPDNNVGDKIKEIFSRDDVVCITILKSMGKEVVVGCKPIID